jgi:hypothetical protein
VNIAGAGGGKILLEVTADECEVILQTLLVTRAVTPEALNNWLSKIEEILEGEE